MRILIFEPNHEGHRLHYVSRLVRPLALLADAGIHTTVALTPTSLASREYAVHLKPSERQFQLHPIDLRNHPSALRSAAGAASALSEAVRHTRPDYLYIPCADGVAQVLGPKRLLGTEVVPADL